MSLPKVVSQDEWTAARRAFLEKEKEFTRQRDRLNTERRELPMVEVDQALRVRGARRHGVAARPVRGAAPADRVPLHVPPRVGRRLPELHRRHRRSWRRRFIEHLHVRDTTYAMASRAPLEKLERWKAKHGWTIPWYSTNDGDFSYDFGATIDASRGFDEFNYRTLDEYAARARRP